VLGHRKATIRTQAIFHWIEAFDNPTRRHSTLGY
jgi:hypothetical protein